MKKALDFIQVSGLVAQNVLKLGSQRVAYVNYLTGKTGLVFSVADLIAKARAGTATSAEYLDVAEDLAITGAAFAIMVGAPQVVLGYVTTVAVREL